jgi:SAM-dependent methyltransferase
VLVNEARWIAWALAATPDGGAVLNVGSSTRAFRESVQPWIERSVFAPLRSRGRTVVHQDLRDDPGVDVVGDLTSPAVRRALGEHRVSIVLCSNLLEHVDDPEGVARTLAELVPPGGHLICTVPRAFPYHPDPIDTLFRPSPAQLRALFPELEVVRADEVPCGTLLGFLLANPVHLARKVGASLRTGAGGGPPSGPMWPWLLRALRVSCVHLRRADGGTAPRRP